MKKFLLSCTLLILTLCFSSLNSYAQDDSGGYSDGPHATQPDLSMAVPATVLNLSNYPNPVKSHTTIEYTIPAKGVVSLIVYNSAGQQVAVIFRGNKAAGTYSVGYNAFNISTGIYVCKLSLLSEKGVLTATRLLSVSK